MIEHNKNFYSLEELKRTRDNLEGYLDNEEVYYFVGAIRYACDEIERLKKREQECIDHYLVQCKYASEMEDKYITANNIINELEKFLIEYSQDLEFRCYANAFLDKLQELKNIGLN